MELIDIVDIARAWDRLGWAVQGQLTHVVEDRLHRANPNALALLRDDFLSLVADRGDPDLAREARTLMADITRHLDADDEPADPLRRELRELKLD